MESTLIEGTDGKMYSDSFLTEIRELNQTLFKTVRSTLEKTPFADCRQTLKDYICLYEETEVKFNSKKSSAAGSESATLSSGSKRNVNEIFDIAAPAKTVKFGNGSSTFVIKQEEDDVSTKLPVVKNEIPTSVTEPSGPILHRATGTSSLLAPLPAFQFKPTVSKGTEDSEHLPFLAPLATSKTENLASSTTTMPKFSFSLPTASTGNSAAPSLSQPFSVPFSGGPFPTGSIAGGSGVAAAKEDDEDAEGEDDSPPVPDAVEVREEGSVYSKPCQLYFRIVGGSDKGMHEKGAGVLFIKHTDGGMQLLVRASNALRTVLLNVMLTKQLPLALHGKQSVRLLCVPNPPLSSGNSSEGKPTLAEFFFKCDSPSDAKELNERLQKERQAETSKDA